MRTTRKKRKKKKEKNERSTCILMRADRVNRFKQLQHHVCQYFSLALGSRRLHFSFVTDKRQKTLLQRTADGVHAWTQKEIFAGVQACSREMSSSPIYCTCWTTRSLAGTSTKCVWENPSLGGNWACNNISTNIVLCAHFPLHAAWGARSRLCSSLR